MTDTHQVLVVETEGGDQPLAKAEGDVLGYQTQLAERQAEVDKAVAKVDKVKAEYEARLATANEDVDRAGALVAEVQAALDDATAALPAARQAQAQYDALPQAEKDRLAAAGQLDRLRAEAAAAQAALDAAQAATEG